MSLISKKADEFFRAARMFSRGQTPVGAPLDQIIENSPGIQGRVDPGTPRPPQNPTKPAAPSVSEVANNLHGEFSSGTSSWTPEVHPEAAAANTMKPEAVIKNPAKIAPETQTQLNGLGYKTPLQPDGWLGDETAAGLKWFRDNFNDKIPGLSNMNNMQTVKEVNKYFATLYGRATVSSVARKLIK